MCSILRAVHRRVCVCVCVCVFVRVCISACEALRTDCRSIVRSLLIQNSETKSIFLSYKTLDFTKKTLSCIKPTKKNTPQAPGPPPPTPAIPPTPPPPTQPRPIPLLPRTDPCQGYSCIRSSEYNLQPIRSYLFSHHQRI